MYKLEFTQLELNKFNLIENEKIRKSAMSIYMYMLKLNKKENKQYAAANVKINAKEISISMCKFLVKYNRFHAKISIRTLKNRIDLLEKLELLHINKSNRSNTYSFCRFQVNKKVNEKVNDLEVSEPVDNTSSQELSTVHKYINSKRYIKNNINNSARRTTYPQFIKSFEEIKDKLDYLIDKNNITSVSAINEIYRRVKKAVSTNSMRLKGVEKYIRLTILSIKKSFIPSLIKQSKAKSKNTNTSAFNNYKQRDYDYGKLERMLLGWDKTNTLKECYK